MAKENMVYPIKKYSVIGRNEILMTCYNEKNNAEWKETDTIYYIWFHFHEMFRIGKSI